MTSTEESSKTRSFTFIVYPSSAPSDWKEQLRQSHLKLAISPLHKPDEEHTKPHYHVIFYNKGVLTIEGAKRKLPEAVPANGYVEPVYDFNVMCRYLLHLDNPEKQQFKGEPYELVECINRFPLDLSEELTPYEEKQIEDDVMDYIRDNNITEYSELCYALKDAGETEMYEYAKHHTYLFNSVIKSRRAVLSR